MKLLAHCSYPIDPAHLSDSSKRSLRSDGKALNGADRTITWGQWQQNPTDEFRFRKGDRYLGRAVWEHYLGFEQDRISSKAIKLSMIRLGNEDVGRKPSSDRDHATQFSKLPTAP
jgi:hypothetical protein